MDASVAAPAQPGTARRRRVIRGLVALAAALGLIVLIGANMGLFSGKRPQGLGFSAGTFKPCSWKPNCVNSTADPRADAVHHIKPLAAGTDAQAAWARLKAVVAASPRVAVIEDRPGYLYAEFSTPTMGFTDDVEFALDAAAGVIHMRSASRLGIRDFGVNRKRLEDIRARFSAAR